MIGSFHSRRNFDPLGEVFCVIRGKAIARNNHDDRESNLLSIRHPPCEKRVDDWLVRPLRTAKEVRKSSVRLLGPKEARILVATEVDPRVLRGGARVEGLVQGGPHALRIVRGIFIDGPRQRRAGEGQTFQLSHRIDGCQLGLESREIRAALVNVGAALCQLAHCGALGWVTRHVAADGILARGWAGRRRATIRFGEASKCHPEHKGHRCAYREGDDDAPSASMPLVQHLSTHRNSGSGTSIGKVHVHRVLTTRSVFESIRQSNRGRPGTHHLAVAHYRAWPSSPRSSRCSTAQDQPD